MKAPPIPSGKKKVKIIIVINRDGIPAPNSTVKVCREIAAN